MTLTYDVGSDTEQSACWICGGTATRMPAYAPLALFRCPECDFGFQPSVETEDVRSAYDTDYFETYGDGTPYGESERQRRYEAQVRLRFLRRFVPRPGRLIEVGSATGFFLSEAARGGWEALGVEPCESVARDAVERLSTRTVVGFVEDLELEPRSFDLACGWHVLEHVPNPLPTLEKLRMALRPGGFAVFEVPNFGGVLSRRDGPQWRYLDPAHHVGQFSPRALGQLFLNAGFEIRLVRTVPTFEYLEIRQSLQPRTIARRIRYGLVTGTPRLRWHANKFDMLRVVAQVPAGGQS